MNSIVFGRNNKRRPVKRMYPQSVDKEIQSMLLPLNIMQAMCFCPKYRIQNNVIYPNSRLLNIILVCGAIFFISVFLHRVIVFSLNDFVRKHMKFIYALLHYDFWVYSVGYILNCFLTIALVDKNIEFVLIIQRISRVLNNKKYLKFFTLISWLSVLCICAAYILLVYNIYWTTSSLIYLLLFCFDVNIIYATRCIHFLKGMLDLWNEEVLRPQLMRDMDMKAYCKVMFQTYTDILNGYDTLKLTFKYFILFHVLDFFSHALLYVQGMIESFIVSRTFKQDVFSRPLLVAVTLLIKNFAIYTILCLYYEKFYIALENCQNTCALISKTRSSDSQLKMSKNIQRLYRSSFKRMSASGLFYIDAALPLSLATLITSYTVVLIQFALADH